MMISLLSKLAADSLEYLRDIGISQKQPLIDDNIFKIVPSNEKSFGDIENKNTISFKPFYTAIKETFKTKKIIPTFESEYVSSSNAYWAFVPQIARLFSNEQLSKLVKNNEAKWVFTSFGRQDTQRVNKELTDYIDSITDGYLDENKILKGWSNENKNSFEGITDKFIEEQPIEWLHSFYKWISETRGRTELILTKPIFLDRDRKAVAAFDSKKNAILFLPIEDGNRYTTVHGRLLENKDTANFIRQIGIKEPSLHDEIYNIILKQYKDGTKIDPRPHFKKFFQYYQTCPQSEAKTFLEEIKEYAFVLCSTATEEKLNREKPMGLYFPFDPLPKWFRTKPVTKFVSFDKCIELVGENKKEELIAFLTDLGVKKVPRIIPRELNHDEAERIQAPRNDKTIHKQTWTEKNIDGCEEIITNITTSRDQDLSAFLWSQLMAMLENVCKFRGDQLS